MKINYYPLFLLLLLCLSLSTAAQTTPAAGDFRSTTIGGSWSLASSWQRYDGITWQPATSAPSATSAGKVEIVAGSTVTIASGIVLIDQLTVAVNGKLVVNTGAQLRIMRSANSSTDFTLATGGFGTTGTGRAEVSGTLIMSNLAGISSSANSLLFKSGSTYRHEWLSGGRIGGATWDLGSTLIINSLYGNAEAPTNLIQSFARVIWNTPNLTGNEFGEIDLAYSGSTFRNIKENLEIINTGSAGIYISKTADYTLVVNKDLVIGQDALVAFTFDQQGSGAFITVKGNADIRSNLGVYFNLDASSFTMDVNGDLLLSGGTAYNLNSGAGNTLINVLGTARFINGSLTTSGTGATILDLNNVEVAAGATTAAANADVLVSGNWINKGGSFSGVSANFFFDGATQTIQSAGQAFGSTTFVGPGTKSIQDIMNIDGDLTIEGSAIIELGGQQLSVAGNWMNNAGTFLPNGGTVTFDGANQSIFSNGQAFDHVQIAGTATKLIEDVLDIDRNLTITSGATLNVALNTHVDTEGNTVQTSYDLYVGGNLVNNGTLLTQVGTIFFDGSTTQTISGTTVTNFNNMLVTNAGATPGVQVHTHQNLLGSLSLRGGSTFDPDGTDGSANFTLVSGPLNTASIGALVDGARVDGHVVVKRYIHGEGILFRYIATPVTNANLDSLANDFTISLAGTDYPSVYIYNESEPGTSNTGWQEYGSSLADPLVVGRGYSVEVLEGSSAVIADVKGPVHQGDFRFPVSFTPTEGDDTLDDGWNLIGNPYPSAIDWTTLYANTTTQNVEPIIWIANNGSGTLTYASYDASSKVGLNGGTPYIASGQGFWVKATAANPQLIIKETNKAVFTTPEFFRTSQHPEDVLVIRLKNRNVLDETALIYRTEAQASLDQYDSYKKKNEGFSFSSLSSSGDDLAYNFMPWFSCTSETPLFLDYASTGTYTISFRELNSFTRPVMFTLLDTYTGQQIAVNASTSYSFEVTADPASTGNARFVLHASYAPLQLNNAVATTAACAGTDAVVTIENTLADVLYQAWIGETMVSEATGNGASLALAIPAAYVQTTPQEVKVKAGRTGCEFATLANTATLLATPVAEITQTTTGITCGSGTVILSAAGAPADGSYLWYESADAATPIEGATEATFTTPALTESTFYYVVAVNASGCESTTRVKVLAEVTTLETPVISQLENQLVASGAGNFQWYLDGHLLEGATAATLSPTANGSYAVEVSAGTCAVLSAPFVYEVLGIDELEKLGVRVWPNPAPEYIFVEHGTAAQQVIVRLYSTDGKLLLSQKFSNISAGERHTLDVRTFKSGLYVLEMLSDEATVRVRLVIN